MSGARVLRRMYVKASHQSGRRRSFLLSKHTSKFCAVYYVRTQYLRQLNTVLFTVALLLVALNVPLISTPI